MRSRFVKGKRGRLLGVRRVPDRPHSTRGAGVGATVAGQATTADGGPRRETPHSSQTSDRTGR